MFKNFILFLLAGLFFITSNLHAQQNRSLNSVNKILYNAKIFTANTVQPYAEAVAISNGKIIAIGNFNEVKNKIPGAELINMNGQFLMPGFIDSHTHALDGGASLLRANVYDSIYTISDLAVFALQTKKDGSGMIDDFLVIDGINISTWSNIATIQKIFNETDFATIPVVLRGSDGHTEWVNKIVLQKAGINKNFITLLDADGKKFYGFDTNNEPNGFIADDGFEQVNKIMPEEKIDWMKAGEEAVLYNNKLGITAWLDPSAGSTDDDTNNHLDTYAALYKQHKLSAHIAATVVANADGNAEVQILKVKSLQKKYAQAKGLSILGFKIFSDGVIEYPSQTAALSKPYRNKASSGALMMNPAKFAAFATAADKAGLLVHVHAIGDLAVTETLNGFEAMRKANGNSTIPHTITHLQIVLPADFERFKKLGVLASYQLLWAYGDVTTIDIVQPYIDPELYKWQYPARSMLQAGTVICGASDWPVSTANPFEAIYNAETRKGPKGVLDSSQCMPRIAMLYAYTINAARAMRMEKSIGSLEAGKFADIIAVSNDVLTASPEEMQNAKIIWTMFEGKIVFEAK